MKRITVIAILISALCLMMLNAAPVEIVQGNLKLVLYPESGTFSLFQLSPIGKNRYEPLFEDRNCSSTSWFSVMTNGRIFRLGSKSGKPVPVEQTENGASFVFNLIDDFQARQNFSFLKDSAGNAYAVRVQTVLENTSGKDSKLALKALIDTNLGESEGIHFFTDLRNRISSETRFDRTADLDSIIVSKNANASLMFYLGGNGSSRPEYVYASNWNRLNTLTWQPEFVEGRSFNTMYAINDSALLFTWKEQNIRANKTLTLSMIMGQYNPDTILTKISDDKTASPTTPATASPEDDDKRMQLIRQLVLRIEEIEANPDSASDAELDKLNGMLDMLLGQGKE